MTPQLGKIGGSVWADSAEMTGFVIREHTVFPHCEHVSVFLGWGTYQHIEIYLF